MLKNIAGRLVTILQRLRTKIANFSLIITLLFTYKCYASVLRDSSHSSQLSKDKTRSPTRSPLHYASPLSCFLRSYLGHKTTHFDHIFTFPRPIHVMM